jgi:predicted NAD/FAD-binding protein
VQDADKKAANFIAFLKALKVPTVPTEMTFGVSRDRGFFEWAGTSLDAVFAQRKNIFSLRMWRMMFDILRFNQFALNLLTEDGNLKPYVNGFDNQYGNSYHDLPREETIGEYLQREGYSDAFRDDYLIPMTAAVWSTSPDKCSLEFPAVTLVRFMWNHHLLTTVSARPQWLTLPLGSKSYIDAVMKGFPPNHHFLNTPVKSITNDPSGRVQLHLQNGRIDTYDHVILATHGDQALKIISASATPSEKSILSAFKTSQNTAILHSDLSLMPKSRKAWSAWNLLTLSSSPSTSVTPAKSGLVDKVCLTYNMNMLQHIPTSVFGDVLVTLNPTHLPPPEKVQGRYTYEHPLYTTAAIRAQSMLHQIQNTRGISYCGAWTKYGFHEDGFSSGLKVAMENLGAELPFEFTDSTYSRGQKPVFGIRDLILRLVILWIQLFIILLERARGVQRKVGGAVMAKRGYGPKKLT